jgi:hypothetical protein
MRFMVMVKSDEKSEAGVLPDEKMLSAMGTYNEKLIKAGIMLAGDGLQASSKGARVRISNKKTEIVDGPFAEAKELVGGFWLLKAGSKDEAIELLKKAPFKDGEVEIRPLYEAEDFGGPADQPVPPPTPRKPGTQRYILLLKADKFTEAGGQPSEQLMSEMGDLMVELGSSGALLSGDGLKPSKEGARVVFTDGKRSVVDGPFTESKEIIAGFSVVQAKTREEAVEWGRRMLDIHMRGVGATEGSLEVRLFFEIEDFPVDPAEKPEGWRKHELDFRDKHG